MITHDGLIYLCNVRLKSEYERGECKLKGSRKHYLNRQIA